MQCHFQRPAHARKGKDRFQFVLLCANALIRRLLALIIPRAREFCPEAGVFFPRLRQLCPEAGVFRQQRGHVIIAAKVEKIGRRRIIE